MNIVTVYTSKNGGHGGTYSPEWVVKLRRGLEDVSPHSFRFECVAEWDMDHEWPGWWSKIEMFRPGRFLGWTLFMDLDTLPVGDLGEIMRQRGEFIAIEDFNHPDRLQSAVMAWYPGDASRAIYETFVRNPEHAMSNFRSDQEFIEDVLKREGVKWARWQDAVPGQIVSYKQNADALPKGARIVCGHGEPRFSSEEAGWAHRVWRSR